MPSVSSSRQQCRETVAQRCVSRCVVPGTRVGHDSTVDRVLTPAVLAEVLLAIAFVVVVPSGTATLIAVRDRRTVGIVRIGPRGFRFLSHALSALVLVALGVFLLANHIRVEEIVFG